MLVVDVIVVDGPNVPFLLGMKEAVKAELFYDARSGRLMRMFQPYGNEVLIYLSGEDGDQHGLHECQKESNPE